MAKNAGLQEGCHAIHESWRRVSGAPDLDETVLNRTTRGLNGQENFRMRIHLCLKSGWQGQAGDKVVISALAGRLLLTRGSDRGLTVRRPHVLPCPIKRPWS